MSLFVPSSFSQGQYSEEFKKFLKAIDLFYFKPNNVNREIIEKKKAYIMDDVFRHAFLQQRRYEDGKSLARKFHKDVERYFGSLPDEAYWVSCLPDAPYVAYMAVEEVRHCVIYTKENEIDKEYQTKYNNNEF